MLQKLWIEVSWHWDQVKANSTGKTQGYGTESQEKVQQMFVKSALDMDLQTDLASPDAQTWPEWIP